jgi:hypothetical protein
MDEFNENQVIRYIQHKEPSHNPHVFMATCINCPVPAEGVDQFQLGKIDLLDYYTCYISNDENVLKEYRTFTNTDNVVISENPYEDVKLSETEDVLGPLSSLKSPTNTPELKSEEEPLPIDQSSVEGHSVKLKQKHVVESPLMKKLEELKKKAREPQISTGSYFRPRTIREEQQSSVSGGGMFLNNNKIKYSDEIQKLGAMLGV